MVESNLGTVVEGNPHCAKSWNDAVERWVLEKADKASLHSDLCILRWLEPHLLNKKLTDINRNLIEKVKIAKVDTGVTNGTVNRMLALLRAILRRAAFDWEWLLSVPKVALLREPKRRVRYLTEEQARRLLSELPAHLAGMAAFALATGLRKSNLTGLEWSQVDLLREIAWIHPDQSKSRRAIAVPLNQDAMRVLSLCIGHHSKYVFVFRGESVAKVSTAAWKKALKRAGIDDFRWHDLRHTWASWHVQNGTPLNVLQELGGWESSQMVRRYAHFSASHLAPYAQCLPKMVNSGSKYAT